MRQPIFTFSVSENDTDNLERVKRLKEQCKKQGRSFSYIVLTAIKRYEEQTPNVQQ